MKSAPRFPRYLALLTLATIFSTGCVVAMPNIDPTTMFGQVEDALPPNSPKASVELRSVRGAKETKEVAFAEGDSVETALMRSGAVSRFRNMQVQLFRPEGQPGSVVHPLQVEFDAGARRVPAQYDYALRPNDRLVVTEIIVSPFDEMLKGFLGPFASGGE